MSSGFISGRLTQPELLIMVRARCYAPRKYAGGAPMGHPSVPEVPSVADAAPAEDYDVSQRQDVAKLRKGAIGLGGVLFLTVTGAAPISAMLFNVPILVGYGQGNGAPAGFIFAAIVLVVFCVGYVAMARKKTTAGGFYSYIRHGLGRELGIGTGYGAVVAYSVFEASLAGGFAYFLSLMLTSFGVHISWPWLALGMVVLIGILTYFDVRLSTVVLAAGLIGEVLILIIFDIYLFSKGHFSASSINPINAFKGFPADGKLGAGAVGIGLFFAFWSWVGFETAPNYGEESRDPKRNVPRALYISVIGLGIFYAVTSWASLGGYSSTHAAIAQAQGNAADYFLTPATHYAGQWVSSVMSYLIITGSFACGMAFHNTTARYLYSLGREGLLPRALGKTHPRWQSPHIASIAQSVMAAIILLAFALFPAVDTTLGAADSVGYLQVYGLMAVMGVVSILAIQAIVSVAIFNYFRTHHKADPHWWTTITAPVLAAISQAYVLYLAIKNLTFLGSGYGYAKWLCWADLVIFLGGLGYAYYLKSRHRAKYETIGRMINE